MREIIFDGTTVNDVSKCYIIAEIGHNHQGDLKIAKEMFQVAKYCGANAVKLQKRDNRTLFTKKLYDSPYESESSYGETYGKHREALEFGYDAYVDLKNYAKEIGVTMFATAFDFPSVDFLEKIDIPFYKTASGDILNIPLLKYIAQTGKPLIISTGGATLEDVERAREAIMPINKKLCLLQCTASYPVEPSKMNLQVITTLREKYTDIVIGLSDHQSGIAMSLAAYVLGARVIEKHFTLNRALRGTDHAFSLEPIGLSKLVRDINRARVAMGDGIKKLDPSEVKPLFKMGKKLVASHDIAKGHKLTSSDIAIKSPNDGLPPYELEKIIGKTTLRLIAEDENIMFEDLTN